MKLTLAPTRALPLTRQFLTEAATAAKNVPQSLIPVGLDWL